MWIVLIIAVRKRSKYFNISSSPVVEYDQTKLKEK